MKATAWSAVGVTAVGAVLASGLVAGPATAAPTGPAASAAPVVATATMATLQPFPVLRQGPNSAFPLVTVRSLQFLLNARGARLVVDGLFGPRTNAAVIAFQRSRGLPATGVVNAATWLRLIITVRLGSTGSAVRAVQDQINFRNLRNGRTLVVDGIFGPRTDAAVRAFQRGVALQVPGFLVDGIVGPMTWQALVSEMLSF
jgi:peptidoglycan hydrolase-like protein with peptidoglycan-binding domain